MNMVGFERLIPTVWVCACISLSMACIVEEGLADGGLGDTDDSTGEDPTTADGTGEVADGSEDEPSDSWGASTPECVDVAFHLRFRGDPIDWMGFECVPGEPAYSVTDRGAPLTTIELECLGPEAEPGTKSSTVVAELEGYAIDLGQDPLELISIDYVAAGGGIIQFLRREGRMLAFSSNDQEWSNYVHDMDIIYARDDECSFGDRTDHPYGLEGIGPSGEMVRETTWAVVSLMEQGHEVLARVSTFLEDEAGYSLDYHIVVLDRSLVVR